MHCLNSPSHRDAGISCLADAANKSGRRNIAPLPSFTTCIGVTDALKKALQSYLNYLRYAKFL